MRFLLLTFFTMTAIAPAGAITVGQIDTFSGMTQFGRGERVLTGGPLGEGDAYYRVTQEDFVLSALNRSDWAGNYIINNITQYDVDLVNLGGTPLVLRLTLSGSGFRFVTKMAFSPPADGVWRHVVFSVAPTDLIPYVETVGGVSNGLRQVESLALYHWPDPTQGPPNVTGSFGMDNLQALPEPEMLGLVGVAALLGCGRGRRVGV